ncbi:MAG: hypothetical protein RL134_425 [Actinomycetota bacterium]|jgi:hypothetical protein
MRPGYVTAALIAVGTLLAGALPASGATIPDDLEFEYTMSSPLIGNIRDSASTICHQSLGESFTMEMTAGPAMGLTQAISKPGNEILCTVTMERILSSVAINGTASASAEGQSGTGSFTLLCEVGQKRSSFFSIAVAASGLPGYGPNPYGMSGSGHVSCSWTISVDDAQKSQLAGTLESFGDYTQDSERVTCEEAGITIQGSGDSFCVAYDMTVQAYLTGATGAYAGRTGEGTLVQRGYAAVTIPLSLDIDTACPPEVPNCDELMGGGPTQSLVGCQYSASQPANPQGWMQLPPLPPGMPTQPGWQGPGWYYCDDVAANLPPSDEDPNVPPCIPGEEGNVPPEGFSTCVNPGASTAMVRALESVVRASTGEGLSLRTVTKAGVTRFVSPAQTNSNPVRAFGSTATTQPTIRLATVPGAMCDVTARAGKVTSKIATKAKATNGQLNTGVTAPALMSRLKAAKGSQATLTATCSAKVGKKTQKIPAASVTVAFS